MHVKLPVAFLCLAAGCSAGPPVSTIDCQPPACAVDTKLQLTAEVVPQAPLPAQEFASLYIDPHTGQFQLKLEPPVTFTGTVSVAGTTAAKLSGNVVATRHSRILGRPDVFYQAPIDPLTGRYSLVVSRNWVGETYSVRVTAAADLVPPQTFTVAATADQQLDLQLDDPTTLPQVVGGVVDALLVPVAGVQVEAIDPATGDVLSTSTATDAGGQFAIRLRKTLPAMVRVVATPAATAKLPILVLDVDTTMLGPTATLPVQLMLPALPHAAHVVYNVVGQSSAGVQIPVVGATCTFYADVTGTIGAKAYYATSAVTDAMGAAAVDLIPTAIGNRSYTVQVSPDPSSSFSSATMMVNVGPQGGYGPAIVLPRRALVTGRALDPMGLPLADVTVVPGAGTLSVPPPLAVPNGAVTQPKLAPGTSDLDGRFSLRVDVAAAAYDIALVPPPDKPLPRLWRSTQVLGDVDVGTIVIPRGVIEEGLIHQANGQPVGSADVRIYTVPASDIACAGNGDLTCLTPARLWAEGTTRSDGTVPIILPTAPAN